MKRIPQNEIYRILSGPVSYTHLGQVAEYLPHALAEAAHLNEAGPDGVPQAHRNEQEMCIRDRP